MAEPANPGLQTLHLAQHFTVSCRCVNTSVNWRTSVWSCCWLVPVSFVTEMYDLRNMPSFQHRCCCMCLKMNPKKQPSILSLFLHTGSFIKLSRNKRELLFAFKWCELHSCTLFVLYSQEDRMKGCEGSWTGTQRGGNNGQRRCHSQCRGSVLIGAPVTPLPLNLYELLEQIPLFSPFLSISLTELGSNPLLGGRGFYYINE